MPSTLILVIRVPGSTTGGYLAKVHREDTKCAISKCPVLVSM